MKKALKYILALTIGLLPMKLSWAQDLPVLPTDPAISCGVLPNGVSFYLVTNPTTEGIADFALAQRTGFSDLGEQARMIARDAMTSLPRLGSASTQSFMASHGVTPGKDGFVKVSDDATLFHFDNVLIAEETVDSVLLVLMDIVDRGTASADSVWKWYAPADHAVIVSGDIDAASIAGKLKMLSYMTPAREGRGRHEYEWQSNDVPVFDVISGATGRYSTISTSWTSQRTPKEFSKTVQPAIYSLFVNELGLLAEERISQRLEQAGIPVADVSYKHVSSLRSSEDESFSVYVTVAPEHISSAVAVMASTMSSLDRGTASAHEMEMVKRRYLSKLKKVADRHIRRNADYIEQCLSAFLYDAPLSTVKDIHDFIKYRDLDVATELKHFNAISSALLDGQNNLTVSCVTPSGNELASSDLYQIFKKAWESEAASYVCRTPVDSMPLPPASLPVKLKSVRKDHLSGGVMWTFTNGFKVVYRRQNTGRRMHFTLALNGGYGNIKGLDSGEGAYVSDYMNLSSVSGMNSADFRIALEKNDIDLQTVVNLSNTMIQGHAPESDVDLMMRVLLGSVNNRRCDVEAFEYYKSCLDVSREFIKGSVQDRILAIDSLLCPGYKYSSLKFSGEITEDFSDNVEEFWKYQAGKTNDGVLVLVGNVEETKLRKILQNYIGGFATTDRVYPRINVNYQPVAGSIAYTFKGNRNSVDVALSSRQPLTTENYMASEIAAGILRQVISKAITGTGMYLRLVHDSRIYPQERFNLMLTIAEADMNGFAHEVREITADEGLVILRKVLADLPEMQISEELLNKHKNVLKGHIALKMQDPQYWIQAIAMRHLDGKDFTTSYESRIDAVTASKVRAVLAPLSSASRVEYITER